MARSVGDNYHQPLAYQMLKQMINDGYFTASRVRAKIVPAARTSDGIPRWKADKIRDNNQYLKNAYLLDHGTAGDSTQATISALCKAFKIKKANVLTSREIARSLRVGEEGAVIFVLDDCLAAGTHLSRAVGELVDVLPEVISQLAGKDPPRCWSSNCR